jgi:hypothetical protein
MNGTEALNKIVDALKDFQRQNPTQKPACIKMSWDFAYDVAKLGRSELGDLASKIWKEGVGALEKEGFFGFRVVIDWENENSEVKIS